jgi:hypothetical protein
VILMPFEDRNHSYLLVFFGRDHNTKVGLD